MKSSLAETGFIVLTALMLAAVGVSAQNGPSPAGDDIRGLPIIELRAKVPSETLAIVLSGDGGWADIDRQIGQLLAERGVDVIGFDDRAYLRTGKRDPNGTGADLQRVAAHYLSLWNDTRLVLVGYSRGAEFAPFVATRLSPDLRHRLALVAMLGLPEHAGFKYRFSDLWATHSDPKGPLILPELERLRGTNMLCVYGTKEEESLCRGIDPTLVYPVAREGAHHFDGDYRSLTELILARMRQPAR